MASNPFTLAALATTAVPDLAIVGATDDGSDHELSAVAVTTADATLRVVVPRTPHVLARTRESVRALATMTHAVRERVPFEVPELLGEAPLQRTGVFVWTRLGGEIMRLTDVSPGHGALASEIGAAIGALHALPTAIVADSGLPHHSAQQIRQGVLDVFDRAAATGRVPRQLLERWERASDDAGLWQFKPCIVHGDLQAQAFRRDGDHVAGIDGWHALSVGDPARDLAWLLGSEHFTSVDEAFAAYDAARDGADRQLRQRAMLHAELDIARWLLHGVETDDASVIEDAEGMLRGLVARVDDDESVEIRTAMPETMDLTGVQSMLAARGHAMTDEEPRADAARHDATATEQIEPLANTSDLEAAAAAHERTLEDDRS